MSRVRSKNTRPELVVRSILHRMGYRFRLHANDLPGSPDILLPRHRKAILVNGCFWHGHNCPRGKRPESRRAFWDSKLDETAQRDHSNQFQLRNLGWQVLTIWECELRHSAELREKIQQFMVVPTPTPK